MAIDSDIRDQAYQFFIQEAPELLQLIEEELLTIKTERSAAKVHNMMRAAHSIKGGAASVGLETIKTLAHSLEDIFKGLHNEELEIDAEVESLLLEAYDCLRIPLIEQINTGEFDADQAMAMAEPVFAQIEAQIGEYLRDSGDLPSSADLGVDITLSIFEVDVAQGLERLNSVVGQPQGKEVAGELRAQVEVFAGIAELLNLPGFSAIAQTTLAALEAQPNQAWKIAQLALADFEAARQAVMSGDRTQGGAPSKALEELVGSSTANVLESTHAAADLFETLGAIEPLAGFEAANVNIFDADIPESTFIKAGEELFVVGATEEVSLREPVDPESLFGNAEVTNLPSLDDVFGNFVLPVAPVELSPNILATTPTKLQQELKSGTIEQQDNTSALEQQFPKEEEGTTIPSLDDVFGNFSLPTEIASLPVVPSSTPTQKQNTNSANTLDSIPELVQSVEQVFNNLPPIEAIATPTTAKLTDQKAAKVPNATNSPAKPEKATKVSTPANLSPKKQKQSETPAAAAPTPQLSVRVDLERLERMNNLVGELSINRNGLSLQNEQLQRTIQDLLRRFAKFQQMGYQLRALSDQMLVAPERYSSKTVARPSHQNNLTSGLAAGQAVFGQADFDSLEMDSYGEVYSLLQGTLEEMMQLEETVGDVVLLAGQSSQTLERQRQMLGHLRDDLMWARMLPLSEVLNRFPRMLRDLSNSYQKPVDLKLSGTGVLVDKAALEKLNDPLVHLVRNAFDHGIEQPDVRRQNGKPEQGLIEIRAYHQGSQTIIEVRDDGRGLNLERIRNKAIDLGLLTSEQAFNAPTSQLLELLFEPGFSTASQVSQLSGRGVGLDVVRAQLRSLKGSVTLTSEPGQGTVFTLRIPLTLTVAKLLICFVGSTAFALPSDSIEEILIPKPEQVKLSGGKRFLHWEEQIVPAYHLSQLMQYACPIPEAQSSQALVGVPSPDDWAAPMLLLSQDAQIIALEIDRLVTEQELVIKPMGEAIAPPSYIYGCTILGDGCLIPVIDAAALLNSFMGESKTFTLSSNMASLPAADLNKGSSSSNIPAPLQRNAVPTILVVDDSITLRQTIALTLQKADYRVLQARDGREAVEQLQKNSTIQLVISDVEMPNMNGFEFLSHRRQDPILSKVPVVMLTSRSSDKHRQLATHLGATAYFTKPYIEQEFLAAIKNIVQQDASVGVPALSH